MEGITLPLECIGQRDSWRYINLDNAATTPSAVPVLRAVQAVMEVYGSIHRGSGLKSVISTELYEKAFELIRSFVGATSDDAVVLASNTTTAINRLAHSYGFERGDVVLISEMEHSSNDLPWRQHATVVRFRSTRSGGLDLEDLEARLRQFGRKARLVALTGASNVTGYLSPSRDVARIAHRYGAEVFVDCAQLVAHRPICMRSPTGEEDLDYIAFSGHKMYAPFGMGVVIGRRHAFERIPPDLPGGGTVEMVTTDNQIWAALQSRLTPGTPNVVGLVAISAAMQMIAEIGFDTVLNHEKELVATGLRVLQSLPGVVLQGQGVFSPGDDRLPIFPFTVEGYSHGFLAAVLGCEYGIGVRQGHLCQYEFMRRELGITEATQAGVEEDLRHGDKSSMYGMVRASCGLCTATTDLECLGDALKRLLKQGPTLRYEQDKTTGLFSPLDSADGWKAHVPKELGFLVNRCEPPAKATV